MRVAVLLALLGTGCNSDDETDTEPPEDTSDPIEGCDETSLFIDGPDEPRVSQSWTVLMRCDGDTLVGPMVVRIDPSSLASIDDNELTFNEAGEGQLRVQVGVYVERMDVTVLP